MTTCKQPANLLKTLVVTSVQALGNAVAKGVAVEGIVAQGCSALLGVDY